MIKRNKTDVPVQIWLPKADYRKFAKRADLNGRSLNIQGRIYLMQGVNIENGVERK